MVMPQRRRRNPRDKAATAALPFKVRWSGFRPFYDYWGNELKRHYQLETLAAATEWMLRGNDRFLVPSVRAVLGPAPISSLSFELFQEGRHQLIFFLFAANARHKRAAFAYVAAKNAEEHSAVARAEHRILETLYQRAPQCVVRPFGGGGVFLPDRHGRKGQGRKIYAYLTEWLATYHELGVTRDLQFFLNVLKPHTLSRAQTEFIKGLIVETMARTYSAKERNAMAPPEIASGDFVVTRPDRGPQRVKLIACRAMVRATPGKYLQLIFASTWDWGGKTFRLCPETPGMLFDALARALGAEHARAWVAEYAALVRRGAAPDVLPEYRAELCEIAGC